MLKTGNELRRRGANAYRWAVGIAAAILIALPLSSMAGDVWIESRPHPAQGLEGRAVAIDAGHGRTWNDTTHSWGWQRPILFGEVEDLITARIVNRWLVPYFQNAGGYVHTMRERDEQLRELYLDDAPASGSMETSGSWTSIAPSDSFAGGARVATTQPDSGGPFAVWSADFPETDRYGLCVWYPAMDTPTTATYIVHTAGGDVLLRVNQRVNTARWLFIDWFVFEKGSHPVVTLTTLGSEPGTVVAADGVRLGGGMGDIEFGGGPSGVPRWQEYSKSYAMLYGAPSTIWDFPVDNHDYNIRYPFMSWFGSAFEFNLHSNADATGGGTSSGTISPWAWVRSEEEAAALIAGHQRVTQLIKERWMSGWRDRSVPTPEIYYWISAPRWLLELAFHDRLDPDLISLVDPDFRSIAARGIYEGIGAMLGGENFVALPEPPRAVSMINKGGGAVQLRWNVPAWGPAVRNYRVYRSGDALAFDAGVDVGNVTEFTFEGEAAGAAFYARVVAENEGGRSFPSETLGARVGDSPTVLVVNGFDRLDRYVQEPDNPRRFVKEHIEAFAAARPGIAIDSAANEAVADGTVALADYPAVDWILGRESRADETFSAQEQTRVSDYFNAGGRLLATGTDIGLDVGSSQYAPEKLWASERLHIEMDYAAQPTRRTPPRADGLAGTPFAGFSCDVSTTPGLPYDAGLADAVRPVAGAQTVFAWADGSGAAAVAYATGPGKTVVSAIPMEAIVDPAARADFAARALDFLLAPLDLESDTTPPEFGYRGVTHLQPMSAVAEWNTDEITVGEVEYGLDGVDYGSHAGPTTIYSRSGSVPLTDLLPGTNYQMRIRARDYAGNESVLFPVTFATPPIDTTPPTIVSLHIYPAITSAMVYLRCDEDVLIVVEYRKAGQDPWLTSQWTSYTPNLIMGIGDLEPDTAYEYRVRVEDRQGNETVSPDAIFYTDSPATTPPAIEFVRVVEVSDRDAILAWQTDQPATAQVEWWTDATTVTLSPLDATMPVAHFYRLGGLTTDTLIHFRVVSSSGPGLESRGPEMTFRTLPPIADVIVDNRDAGFSVVGTWATSTMAPEQRWGSDYRYRACRYVGDPVYSTTWKGTLSHAGMWQAHCWYVVGPNRATNVPYTVRFPGGEETVRMDQKNDGGTVFHPIGQAHHYGVTTAEIVMSNDAGPDGVVIADAVLWGFRGLGEAFYYRYLMAGDIVRHVLDTRTLEYDGSAAAFADRNGDGVVDVADAILRRMELNEAP